MPTTRNCSLKCILSNNLVVIGDGTAGLFSAAGLGAKVALIERSLIGGDCLNTGCAPSKAVIRSARAAHDVREAKYFGIHAQVEQVDFAAAMGRMREVRAKISHHDSFDHFKGLGIN